MLADLITQLAVGLESETGDIYAIFQTGADSFVPDAGAAVDTARKLLA
ncbi:MAG: hypothetical protein WBB69_08950 [Anaerolineales bacterium]